MKKHLLFLLSVIPLTISCSTFSNPSKKDNDQEQINDDNNPDDPIDIEPTQDDIDPTDEQKDDPIDIDPTINDEEDIIDPSFDNDEVVFNEFFKYGNKINIDLYFSNSTLLKLKEYGRLIGNNDNYIKNEMYHPCKAVISINDKTNTYYEVGARMRGNTSRNYHFIDDDGYFNPYALAHFKLSFSQTFDDEKDNDYYIKSWNDSSSRKARDNRKFGGMKKIDLKWNRNYDNTFTKEIYCLDSFLNEGILAQHCNLVNLTIHSEVDSISSIYQAFEAVDKQLLKKQLIDDSKGDLFKCLYQNSKADLSNANNIGVETTGFRPTYSLKTNEKNNDFSSLTNIINIINKTYKYDGVDGESYYNNISNYIDIDNFLKYSALCWTFGLPDDLRNNANNYYLYINKDNKGLFLPYDNDRCLGIRYGWDKDLSNVSYDDPYAAGYNEFNSCPLVLRLLSGGSNNTHPVYQYSKDLFKGYCEEFANKYLDNNKFKLFTEQFDGIAPSIDINEAGPSNDTFNEYCLNKLATLNNH